MRQDVQVIEAGEEVASVPLARTDDDVRLYAADDVMVNALLGQRIVEKIIIPNGLQPPVRKGDDVGRMEVWVDGEKLAETPVYVNVNASEPTFQDRLQATWKRLPDAPAEGWDAVKDVLSDLAKL
jgi:D-alanyl-D-alanine carboxypeptidase (penicillin-binding protein 5/6)